MQAGNYGVVDDVMREYSEFRINESISNADLVNVIYEQETKNGRDTQIERFFIMTQNPVIVPRLQKSSEIVKNHLKQIAQVTDMMTFNDTYGLQVLETVKPVIGPPGIANAKSNIINEKIISWRDLEDFIKGEARERDTSIEKLKARGASYSDEGKPEKAKINPTINNTNNDLKKVDPPKEVTTIAPISETLKTNNNNEQQEKECFICKGNGHHGAKESKVICPNQENYQEAVTRYYDKKRNLQSKLEKKAKQVNQVLSIEAGEEKVNTEDQDLNPRKIIGALDALLFLAGEIGYSSMGCWAEQNGIGPLQFVVVDTGAQVSCYDNETFKLRHPGIPIHPADVDLVSIDNDLIQCVGYGTVLITSIQLSNGEELPVIPTLVDYYLTDGLKYTVLSDQDASDLNILKWMQKMFDSNKIVPTINREVKTVRRRDLSRIIIPDEIFELFKELHSTELLAGHPGANKLYTTFKLKHPNVPITFEQALKYVVNCPDCQRKRRKRISVRKRPMDLKNIGDVQIDTFKLRLSKGLFMTFLTIVCMATGMLAMFKLRNDSAYEVAMKLLEAQQTFPFKQVYVQADQGKSFISELVDQQMQVLGVTMKFGVSNSHTDQTFVEGKQAIVRSLVRPFFEQICAESTEDEATVAIPIVCCTMNSTKDPVTGLSPFDVYCPMNSTEFSLVEIPENVTIEHQAGLISLILDLQTKFFKLLQKKHDDYLQRIKYKEHVDDYPNPGE